MRKKYRNDIAFSEELSKQREMRLRMDHHQSSIENASPRIRKPSVSAPGLALSMVSFVLVLSLIVTVFFAYDNSISNSDKFHYFSPFHYFSRLSEKEILVPSGRYSVEYKYKSGALGAKKVSGIVYINDYKFVSINFGTVDQVKKDSDFQFEFKINGVIYSTVSYDSDPDLRWLYMPEIVFEIEDVPDFQVVIDAWSDSQNSDLFNAFGTTFTFVGDWVRYYTNLFTRLSPFDSFVEGDRDYLDTLLPPLDS